MSAEEYLQAVVSGSIRPEVLRVQAARTLIGYQRGRARVRVRNQQEKQLLRSDDIAIDRERRAAFEIKAAEIRREHKKGKNGG